MTPAERPPEPLEPTADSPALDDPALSHEEALVLNYIARNRAKRERRRGKRRMVVGALVVSACLLTAGLFWSRHQRPPIVTEIIELTAGLLWSRYQGPPIATGIIEPPTVGPDARPAAVTPPASPRTSEAPRPAASPVAPATPPVASTPAPAPRSPSPGAPTPPEATAPAARVIDVSYQPSERLKSVHTGDAKETVFELFGTKVERRNGSLVQVEGMRLRASGRSARHAQVEVAEVRITDAAAAGSLYWFLFGDGRLIAWGRANEWPVAAARYQVEIEYEPDRS
jgi:hypothetical protein